MTGLIITSEGRIMHGLSLIYVMREIQGVEEFKIIQEDKDKFLVQIVPSTCFDHNYEENIRKGFQRQIGNGIIVRFDFLMR